MTPRENPNLFGQGDAEHSLNEAIASGRLHHAWIISGVEGIGKATLAYRFARRLLAGTGQGLQMAPDHPVFRRVAAKTHADLLTVEREFDEKKKRWKKQISAESVRGIPGFLRLTPAEGGARVVIVDGAEDLNAASANALLKILEEPPARAVLILVTSAPGRLLPTLRSRCRQLKLLPLEDTAMEKTLTSIGKSVPREELQRLLRLSQGAPGRALMLLDEGGLKLADLVDEVLSDLAREKLNLRRAYAIADALREESAFDLFMGLLADQIANVAAGRTRPELARLRPAKSWAEIWAALVALTNETAFANMDRRQAAVAGIALLRGEPRK